MENFGRELLPEAISLSHTQLLSTMKERNSTSISMHSSSSPTYRSSINIYSNRSEHDQSPVSGRTAATTKHNTQQQAYHLLPEIHELNDDLGQVERGLEVFGRDI